MKKDLTLIELSDLIIDQAKKKGLEVSWKR